MINIFCTPHPDLLEFFACMVILHAFLSSADFLSKSTFSKTSFRNTIRVSNSLDPDQARQNVGPDLVPNCLKRLTADDKFCHLTLKAPRNKKCHKHVTNAPKGIGLA